ncbi:hypothetical protein BTO10_02100 [Vibrio chagasii]|uniref:Uncharacterized protein n=1 Tax=Vibrio chagasii TaxID=170679 RepID=A0A2S7VP87_9VIBR|nr:Imm41 family immunity protein [Vibrio chagasii]PQJ63632.1 hypothetical protein BTO10_02100 [Vibrio chagasii]
MSNNPIEEVLKNMPGNGSTEWENTFYGCLAECGVWDTEKFWFFHRALTQIGELVQQDTDVDRNLVYALLYIQHGVLTHIGSHFDPRVDWKVESIDDEDLQEYAERFQIAVLSAISGKVMSESSFDLTNPLLCNT